MKREPVLTAASIAALVGAGIAFARLMGWIPMNDDQYAALMIFVGLLVPILWAYWIRGRVTPMSDPRDNDGTPLVRSR